MSNEIEPSSHSTEEPVESYAFPSLEEMATLLPQYEFHDILGVGGMGAVYLARQVALDRWVAIKLLPASASLHEDDASRFIVEARSMARLTHAHIAAVYDFGQTPEGHLYLVMEHINGLDLHRLIHRNEVTPAHARSLITQLCDALQYAHDQNVIHRDIKPANILIAENWQAKVVDFGLARDKNAYSSGEIEYGTPDYVAPERLLAGANVDHRADIYALGVVIHEMFTKLTPQAAGADACKNMPAEFASVVSRCMMADPARRFQHCSEIKKFLSAAAAIAIAPATTAKTDVPAYRPPPPHLQARMHQKPVSSVPQPQGVPGWLWACACIGLLMVGGWFIQQQRSQVRSDPAAASAPKAAHETTTQETNTPATPVPSTISDAPAAPSKPETGKMNKLVDDKDLLDIATKQLSNLKNFDPELAALYAKASPADSLANEDQLLAQVRDLTHKYGAALKRSAVTASPRDQINMNAEVDAIAKGQPVPDASTDAATSGDHKRFRGIYRQQLAQLETRRKESAIALRQNLGIAVQTLSTTRKQAGDRLGATRCQALLVSLSDLKPFDAIVASAFGTSNHSTPSAAPTVASFPSSKPLATTSLKLPPTTTAPASAPATKVPFATGVKIEVVIGRPSKIKGGDFDDKMQVMEPRIKLTNISNSQSYEGFKATFMLIGESAVDIKVIKVLQREEVPVSIPIRQFIENKPSSTTTQYDTTGAKFGFKYDGWVVQVADPDGNIVATKSTSPTWEKMPELVKGLKADQCYDKKLKPVAEPRLRF